MAASEHVQPPCRREDALSVVQSLQRAGHIAYFAGGCVRDMLWNLTPKDFDVATDAPPQRVRDLFPRSQGVGQAFGVVLVRQQKSQIEVATFRADGSYSDGRRPDDVRFATPQEDAQRRDFTINGVFFDPISNRVIDFVNGQLDLASRTLRAIGDPAKRFAEDYLRMLRAVRFTSRFDLAIDPATAAAIRGNAHKLPRIAPERICDELRATFALPCRDRIAAMLHNLRLTSVLIRSTFEGKPAQHEVKPRLFPSLSNQVAPFSLLLVLFTFDELLANEEPIESILKASRTSHLSHQLRQLFRLSNEETAEINTILEAGHLLFGGMPSVARLKRYLARPASELGVRMLEILSRTGIHSDRVAILESAFASFPNDQIAPAPWVDGSDLQAAGFVPGPAFKRVLDAVYDAQLESTVLDKSSALELARGLMASQTEGTTRSS